MRVLWNCVIIGTLAAALGCAGSQSGANDPDGLDWAQQDQRLRAIQHAGETKDRKAVPRLIDALESDDPATRMFAIVALEKITGTRMDYNPYAPPSRRQQAVAAWVRAAREGRLGAPIPAHQLPLLPEPGIVTQADASETDASKP